MLKQVTHFLSPSLLAKSSRNHYRACKLTLDHPLLSSLEKCSNMKDLLKIHGKMITTGLIQDVFAASRLVKFCSLSRSGNLNYALSVFTQIVEPDVFTFNIMIKGYALGNNPWQAISLYGKMALRSIHPNEYTFPVLIKACWHVCAVAEGTTIHGHVVKFGFEAVIEVRSSLIHFYASCGLLESGRQVFDESTQRDVVSWNSMLDALSKSGDMDSAQRFFVRMPERNIISWSVMINGYVWNGMFMEALGLFSEMQMQDVKPDETLLLNLISACAHLGALDQGTWFHAYLDKGKLRVNPLLLTALVDMYAKCGSIEDAEALFRKSPQRDLATWNAMINGHAMHGDARKAIALFQEMVRASIMPDVITFVGVLTACSHVGLVDKGREYFNLMTQVYQISPEFEHYGCMVDLLGRAGHLSEAEELAKAMPLKTEPSIWGALLNACKIHGNVEMGKRVGRILIELDPGNCGRYALLCNVFANGGEWDEAARVRKMMRDRGVKKTPGSSLINLNGALSKFVMGDCCHPEINRIYRVLNDLTEKLKLEGYVPCTKHVELELN